MESIFGNIIFQSKNKSSYLKIIYCILFCSIFYSKVYSQIKTSIPDSISHASRDSINKNISDSTKNKSDIDTLVTYTARDSIVYDIKDRTSTLYGKASIIFRTWKIEAEIIKINWVKNTLYAKGITDPKDSTKQIGLPTFTENNDVYKGIEVSYNFKTKSGVVKYGETTIDNGYYKGLAIKKSSEDYYFVKDGIYTTCDDPHPHFCFASSKMKVIAKEQIIAEPVIFYIADLPVFMIPFAVLPSKGGRTSGIIPPTYGDSRLRGRNLQRFGYYWAINDYMDTKVTADWYTKGGYVLNSDFQYNKRYDYNGRINLSYSKQKFDIDLPTETSWRIAFNHNQNINPTTSLNADLTFLSGGNYYQNTSNNLNELLLQNIKSNAYFSKRWEGTNNSLSISASRDQVLSTGSLNEELPSASFTLGQVNPFKSKNSAEPKWYELLGFNYSTQMRNNHQKTVDSISTKHSYARGIRHDLNFNFSPKLGFFNITPSISYSEYWYDKIIKKENYIVRDFTKESSYKDTIIYTDSVVTRDISGFRTTRSFQLGVSASTRFYGIFQPGIFGINGIRHTVTPSISYNFTPDFSDPVYNNYDSYINHLGQKVNYSKFEGFIMGGPSASESQNIGFNVGNVFEMKTVPKDTSSEETKIQLLNLNLSTNYNFAADSMRLQPLSLSFRTNILNTIDLSGSASYSFYKFNSLGNDYNEFLLKDNKLMRLTTFGFSLSTSFKGEKTQKKDNKDSLKSANTKDESTRSNSGTYGLYDKEIDMDIPWSLSLSFDYNYSKINPNYPTKSANFRADLNFSLTENWRFTTGGYYDAIQNRFSALNLSIQRDLHCWIMSFNWNPIGKYSNFYFEIKIKAPQLQDIKLTKQGSTRGVGGY